jgi:hypothetical protein
VRLAVIVIKGQQGVDAADPVRGPVEGRRDEERARIAVAGGVIERKNVCQEAPAEGFSLFRNVGNTYRKSSPKEREW